MSHAVIPVRGTTLRIVASRLRSSSRPCSVRPAAIRSRVRAARSAPSCRSRAGLRSFSAARTALASPTRPNASYDAPIRSGAASIWTIRPRGRSWYWPVVSAPSSVPTQRSTSADSRSSWNAPSSQPDPTARGWSSGKAPLPMYVVATGASSLSARPTSSSHARDLARDGDDRAMGARRFHERRQRDERARAGREEKRRGPAGDSRVAIGGKPRVEFGPEAQRANAARPQALPDRERVHPGQPECDLSAEPLERLRDEVTAGARLDRLGHARDPNRL